MNNLAILFLSNILLSNVFAERFNEGGPLMMSLILICFVVSLTFLIRGFLSLKSNLDRARKMLKLTVDSSLLGLVIGFFGSIIGLIMAFDTVQAMGDAEPAVFAAGLKVSLLTALFGLFTFVVSRFGILILRALLKVDETQ